MARWRCDRRAVAGALVAGRPGVRQYLGRRALVQGDYATFSRHTDDGQLRPVAVDALAERELKRLASSSVDPADSGTRASRWPRLLVWLRFPIAAAWLAA